MIIMSNPSSGLFFGLCLVLLLGHCYGKLCVQDYDCTATCTKRGSTSTDCGWWSLSTCVTYSTVKYTCNKRCSRSVCCSWEYCGPPTPRPTKRPTTKRTTTKPPTTKPPTTTPPTTTPPTTTPHPDFLKATRSFVRKGGCYEYLHPETTCGTDGVRLSSTHEWFLANGKTVYTHGIVFININGSSLPVSLNGFQMQKYGDLASRMTYSTGDSRPIPDFANGVNYTSALLKSNCMKSDSNHDEIEFIRRSPTILPEFFLALENFLPLWLRFSSTKTTNTDSGQTSVDFKIKQGSNIYEKTCRLAPIDDNIVYFVLQFSDSFVISFFGQDVKLPKPVGNSHCIIIDVCSGGSMYLTLAEQMPNFLQQLEMFETLFIKRGLRIVNSYGLGVSLIDDIDGGPDQVEIWNGQRSFQHPVLKDGSNLWLGGKVTYEVSNLVWLSGDASMYLSVPHIDHLVESIFMHQWELLLLVKLKLRFKFTYFGGIFGGSGFTGATVLASLGGTLESEVCGENASPSGIFLSFLHVGDLFWYPVNMNDFISSLNQATTYHVFISKTPKESGNVNVTEKVIEELQHLESVMFDLNAIALGLKNSNLSQFEHPVNYFDSLRTALNTKVGFYYSYVKNVSHVFDEEKEVPVIELSSIASRISQYRTQLKQDQDEILAFINTIDGFNTKLGNLTDKLQIVHAKEQVTSLNVIQALTNNMMSTLTEHDNYGFRFKSSFNGLGLKILKLDLEVRYSATGRVGSCGKYKKLYDIFENETSIRLSGFASPEMVPMINELEIDEMVFNFDFVLSLEDEKKNALAFHAKVFVFDTTITTTVIVQPKKINYFVEGIIFDKFNVQIDIGADFEPNWDDLHFMYTGRLLADADGENDFRDNYRNALEAELKKNMTNANERIESAKRGLAIAQKGLKEKQALVEKKKTLFTSVNNSLNNEALPKLERAKASLVEAKRPFNAAENELHAAQRTVNGLCKIKTCNIICVSGWYWGKCSKTSWWTGRTSYYGCWKRSSCASYITQHDCMVNNNMCYPVRANAFSVLAAAKTEFARVLKALDNAKAALSAAESDVKKKNHIIAVEFNAFTFAEMEVKAYDFLLDVAEKAQETVKKGLQFGLKIAKHIKEQLVEVRDCGFELKDKDSTRDLVVIDADCDVNFFDDVFREFRIQINFHDIIHSICHAAKTTVDKIASILYGKRRHRNIQYLSTGVVETEDIISQIFGLQVTAKVDEYSVRTEIFTKNCKQFKNSLNYFQDSFKYLVGMTTQTVNTMAAMVAAMANKTAANTTNPMDNFNFSNAGIDLDVARNEFNMTQEDIDEIVRQAREDYAREQEEQEKQDQISLQNNLDEMNNMAVVANWLQEIESAAVYTMYFGNESCFTYTDCGLYSISNLHDMFFMYNNTIVDPALEVLSDFKDGFLRFMNNTAAQVKEAHANALALLEQLGQLDDVNIFCSTLILKGETRNTIALTGTTLNLVCNVTGDPEPSYRWFKNVELMDVPSSKFLNISRVSKSDTGSYHCVAENIIANLTVREAQVLVLTAEHLKSCVPWSSVHPETEESPHVCYELLTPATNWKQSEKACKAKGGYLVQITEQRVQDHIYYWLSHIDLQQPLWIDHPIGYKHWTSEYYYSNWYDTSNSSHDTDENMCPIFVTQNPMKGKWMSADCYNASRDYGGICEFNSRRVSSTMEDGSGTSGNGSDTVSGTSGVTRQHVTAAHMTCISVILQLLAKLA